MGFSTSAAAAVIFVGALVSLGVLYPATAGSFERVNDALGDREDRLLDQRNTDVSIETVTYNETSENVTIEVSNAGTTTLAVNDSDTLIDGKLRTENVTLAVENVTGRSLWAPGETLTITVENVSSVPARVKVVTEYGVAAASDEVEVI
jgi:flagellar protein FlaF